MVSKEDLKRKRQTQGKFEELNQKIQDLTQQNQEMSRKVEDLEAKHQRIRRQSHDLEGISLLVEATKYL